MFFISRKKVNFILIIILLIICLALYYSTKVMETNTTPSGYVVIVIDDLGNGGEGIDELTSLDIPITVAVMPFLPYTEIDTKKAYDAGMEIILHMPMEPERGDPKWLGPGAIKNDYTEEQVRKNVVEALEQIELAKGINNHMGSKVMKNEKIMEVILNVAKENNLYFLNSRTDESDISEKISKDLNVQYFIRDVFLDNEKNENSIDRAMLELGKIAKEMGYAIGIGHVGAQGGIVTINSIKKMSKKLEKEGIEFIHLSQLKDVFTNVD